MTITGKPTHYNWMELTIDSGNTIIKEDISNEDIEDLIEMLEEVISDSKYQIGIT